MVHARERNISVSSRALDDVRRLVDQVLTNRGRALVLGPRGECDRVDDSAANQSRGRKNTTSRVTITMRPRAANGKEWKRNVQEFPKRHAKNIRQYPRKLTSNSHKPIVISNSVRRVMLSPFGARCSERRIFVPLAASVTALMF